MAKDKRSKKGRRKSTAAIKIRYSKKPLILRIRERPIKMAPSISLIPSSRPDKYAAVLGEDDPWENLGNFSVGE